MKYGASRTLRRNALSALYYPIAIANMTFIVRLLFMPETKDRDIHAEDQRRDQAFNVPGRYDGEGDAVGECAGGLSTGSDAVRADDANSAG